MILPPVVSMTQEAVLCRPRAHRSPANFRTTMKTMIHEVLEQVLDQLLGILPAMTGPPPVRKFLLSIESVT